MKYVILLLLCVTQVQGAGKRSQDGAKDLYCARENCYDVLGVENTATKSEIKRAFRQISIKHHPDKTKDPKSPDIFSAAANAYEILSSVESRENYDYYQAHPEESLNNMFGYYAQAAKKISTNKKNSNMTPTILWSRRLCTKTHRFFSKFKCLQTQILKLPMLIQTR